MNREIKDTPYYSKTLGKLPKGCQYCVKGEKLVLYITGICPRQCWYCPLSERRKDKDVIFINEFKTNKTEDLIKEAKISQSKGAGITGGDPLSRLDRTIEYITILKKEFTKEFHIHLYTSFNLATKENLEKLYNVGLDEIRFHADFENKNLWKNIENAQEFNWDIGLEIPAIPKEKEKIIEICNYFNNKIKFLNLNEFETSDLNSDKMIKHGYDMKSDISHGIKGSEEISIKILEYVKNNNLNFNVHYCSSKLKDKVQMQNRFKLRAENVKTKYDIITDEGMMIRGIIYLKDYQSLNTPQQNKIKKIEDQEKQEIIKLLQQTKEELKEEGLETIIDETKLRLITYPEHIEQFKEELKTMNLIPVILEEDPTVENFEVNKDYL